jgi:hypothetical protein
MKKSLSQEWPLHLQIAQPTDPWRLPAILSGVGSLVPSSLAPSASQCLARRI